MNKLVDFSEFQENQSPEFKPKPGTPITLDHAIQMIPQLFTELANQRALIKRLIRDKQMPELLTDEEAAKILGIKPVTLYGWVHQKRISVIKVGKLNMYDSRDIQAFIEQNRVKARV